MSGVLAVQELPPLLTAEQAAKYLQLSLRSVRRLIATGELPCVRIGRSVRIRREEVMALVDRNTGVWTRYVRK